MLLVSQTEIEDLCCVGPVCYDWTVFNYSCYKFFDHTVQLNAAGSMCRNHSGHVTSINSMEENEFMTELVDQDVWLGLRIDSWNQTANDVWWSDSSPVTYANWSRGYSNYGQAGILRSRGADIGGWESVPNNASFPFVCKKGRREIEHL